MNRLLAELAIFVTAFILMGRFLFWVFAVLTISRGIKLLTISRGIK